MDNTQATNPESASLAEAISTKKISLFRLALVGILSVSIGLFVHDSGATLLRMIQLGFRALIIPLLLAIVCSYILEPLINSLERKGISRPTGIFLVFAVLFFLFCMLVYLLVPYFVFQLQDLRAELPRYASTMVQLLVGVEHFIQDELHLFENLNLTSSLSSYIDTRRNHIFLLTIGTVKTSLSIVVLVPLFSFFFLLEGRVLKRSIINYVPNRYFESMLIIFHHISTNLGFFIRGRFYEAAIVGVIALVGLKIVGLKYFWLFAIIVGVLNLIPIFGPLVAMAITCAFTLLDSGNWVTASLVLSVLLFGQLVDNVFLIPVLIARTASLHFITGIIAIVVGGQIFGAVGMIIAVPFVSILKLIFQEIFRHWNGSANDRLFAT